VGRGVVVGDAQRHLVGETADAGGIDRGQVAGGCGSTARLPESCGPSPE
jgi:hypothetical protein